MVAVRPFDTLQDMASELQYSYEITIRDRDALVTRNAQAQLGSRFDARYLVRALWCRSRRPTGLP